MEKNIQQHKQQQENTLTEPTQQPTKTKQKFTQQSIVAHGPMYHSGQKIVVTYDFVPKVT